MRISGNNARRPRRRVYADEEIEDVEFEDIKVEDEGASVDPEAMGLLFEAEDVAELVAEITEKPVEVSVDDEAVVFAVGDDEFTVTPEGDEEILEAVRRPLRGKRPIKSARRPVRAAGDRAGARRPAPTRRPIPRRGADKIAQAEEVKRPVKDEEKKTGKDECKGACDKKAKDVKASRTIKVYPKKK